MQEAVFFEAFVAGAAKLNAALVALAALADRDDGDCAHQAQQRACYALVALVRALVAGVGDPVNDDRQHAVEGKSVSVLVRPGGRRSIKKQSTTSTIRYDSINI